ncbi:hypothetical protein [Amycolatopsis eburnea]|uniref:Uncharacterized protein n=1 Tax=Amycolatopsis eburnea TaxID=2267691 RepID=A0A3R9DSI0_9PSEU|nr:hypothetical protein [Amycolatopsis eburnea]RSD26352.1 hypothetical protein EIY87_00375 [Amycolatopsis eburnea]
MPKFTDLAGDLLYGIEVPAVAAGAAVEQPGLILPKGALITSVRWVPGAAITANGTNFATISLRNRGSNGAGSVVPWSRSYAAGNGTANAADSGTLSGTSSDLQPAAGDVLTATIAHSGTGLAIPAGLLQVALRWRS